VPEALSPDAEEYLSWLAVEKGRSRNTLAAYRRDIATYEAWVSAEWSALEVHAGRAADARSLARAIVAEVLAHHRRWRVFRASLRALVAADPVARRFYHRQRRRQLRWLASLRAVAGRPARSPEEDFLLVCSVERVCDAAADGELAALDLSAREVRCHLEDLVRAHLAGART